MNESTSIKRYMDYKKNVLMKGRPKTETTLALESLLDEKPKKNAMVKKKPLQATENVKVKSNADTNDVSTSSSLWSRVDRRILPNKMKPMNSNVDLNRQAALTLDDLLGTSTISQQTKSQRLHRSSTSNSSSIKKDRATTSHEERSMAVTKIVHDTQNEASSCLVRHSSSPLINTCTLSNVINRKDKKRKRQQFVSGFTSSFVNKKGSFINKNGSFINMATILSDTSIQTDPKERSTTVDISHHDDPFRQDNIQRICIPNRTCTQHSAETSNRSIDYDRHLSLNIKPQVGHDFVTNSRPCLENKSLKSYYSEKQTFTKKSKTINNDNFVRLNLRNSSGACKGTRSLKSRNLERKKKALLRQQNSDFNAQTEEDDENENSVVQISSVKTKKVSIDSIIDPLDDFLDGTFHNTVSRGKHSKEIKEQKSQNQSQPICPRHQRPCKLLVVKKNSGGNKGRKFFVCSLPRGEQCDFFQWEEDTVHAAQTALLHSSSTSGFITRQVATHVERLSSLTLPELRIEATKRGLKNHGKKGSLLARLSVWIRDQVCQTVQFKEKQDNCDDTEIVRDDTSSVDEDEMLSIGSDSDSVSSDESSNVNGLSESSDDELEICDAVDSVSEMPACEDTSISYIDDSLDSILFKLFGHRSFRPGQEWAISRCLDNKRSILVAPTGQGKSLCYALPAAVKDGLCIVISPLISLMEDQLRHLPPSIPSATLSGQINKRQMATIIDDIIKNRLKILFVSPERLTSSAFRRLLTEKKNPLTNNYERQLPPISLLCVDEAHCLSQWGHNFRVSYLRLRTILAKLNPESVLALTATAGPAVISDICHVLQINEEHKSNQEIKMKDLNCDEGVKVLNCNRDNIDVEVRFVTDEENRLKILMDLLVRPKVSQTSGVDELSGSLADGSVIIYVWRQKDAEVITEQLKGIDVNGGVVCYHGGMDSRSRSKAQGKFMRGKARICVATVAFGLGINKSNVRGVIHLCLPPSPEHYLQEIGRAGRDGYQAKAIALILEDEIQHKLSLSYSDRISHEQVRAVIDNITYMTNDAMLVRVPWEDTVKPIKIDLALPIDLLVKATDCKEETIQTILSILEDTSSYCDNVLTIEGIISDVVTITLKRRDLANLANDEAIAKCIQSCGRVVGGLGSASYTEVGGTATQKGFSAYSLGVIEFSVVKCCRLLGPHAEPRHVYAALRRLQLKGELELNFGSSGKSFHICLNPAGINLFNTSALDDNRLDVLSNAICNHFQSQDTNRAFKVMSMHQIIKKVSEVENETDDTSTKTVQKSTKLEVFQNLIHDYFESDTTHIPEYEYICVGVKKVDDCDPSILAILSSDVTSLIIHPSLQRSYDSMQFHVKFGDTDCQNYSGLLIAKILHGLTSPRTPVLEWYTHPLWGKWRSLEFTALVEHITKLVKS